ncbi:MAG TPA: hypothetical protein VFV38_20465 [Ktedonobacteraceae bacterium]|nr:hypothetical protein [Ktedonobacteraceae bacterium]
MRKAKKKNASHHQKKASAPPKQRGNIRALQSPVKIANAASRGEEKISIVKSGQSAHLSHASGSSKLFQAHHATLYERAKKVLPHLTRLLQKLYRKECELARTLRKYIKTVIGNTLLLIFFTLVGLNSPANSSPLFTVIYQHEVIAILVIALLLVYFVRILLVATEAEEKEDTQPAQRKRQYIRPLFFLNLLSYTSSVVLLVALLFLLLRPSPAPQHIPVFPPHSVHDTNLEMSFIATQSTFYAIPGNPSQYTPSNLPETIPALRTDGETSLPLYSLIIGLNSLQQGRFGMIIEEVNLAILHIAPLPHPLNVWQPPLYVDNGNDNQYRGIYLGQQAGAVMPTEYLRFPHGYVQLKPGGTDQIDIHLTSRIEANFWFTVQIIYRLDNESILRPLRLTQQFEVMFANASDWQLYHSPMLP